MIMNWYTLRVISGKEKNAFIMIEGPRLLFPFARATIANVTREGGFLPLNIQPIDFVAVFKTNIEAKQSQASQSETKPSEISNN